jgi:putative glycosyltransferase (TIGR04348 family)
MARITIVTPARPGTRTGNLHTATRWARMLRSAGFSVRTMQAWDGQPCDLLLVLHARRSHPSVLRWKEADPAAPLVVALTGTDLYRDLPRSAEARRSLELADRIVVLQEAALRDLDARVRGKAHVVYQSSGTRLRQAPPRGAFRIAVVGHLREEKDPFRAVHALSLLPRQRVRIVQVGGALDAGHERQARAWTRREPRYRWLGSLPHGRALQHIARSHALVVSSRMEGGANVIAEAARIGTPVLASRVSGNLGMLGASYPGYYRLGDEKALAALILRCMREPRFYAKLVSTLQARRHLFAPAGERAALLGVVRRALRRRPPAR